MSKFVGEGAMTYLLRKIKAALLTKVDKIEGKSLSSEDYTTEEKNKLSTAASINDVNNAKTLTGDGAPTTDTIGVVGQLYMDITTTNIYKCTAINDNTYTWVDIIN